MIELALEIPTPHLGEFMPWTDLGFALAQEVLSDKEYMDFYRSPGPDVILDNGMLETGRSLTLLELWDAVELIKPTVLIAPDAKDEMGYGTGMYEDTVCSMRNPNTSIGFVVQGRTLGQRVWSLHYAIVNYLNPICLPYRTDRELTWRTFDELYPNLLAENLWIHLLGLRNFKELAFWRQWSQYNRVSLDTGKVFEIEAGDFSIGNFNVTSKKQLLVDRELTKKQISNAHANIEILKARLK